MINFASGWGNTICRSGLTRDRKPSYREGTKVWRLSLCLWPNTFFHDCFLGHELALLKSDNCVFLRWEEWEKQRAAEKEWEGPQLSESGIVLPRHLQRTGKNHKPTFLMDHWCVICNPAFPGVGTPQNCLFDFFFMGEGKFLFFLLFWLVL